MSARQVALQAFLHILAFALMAMGSIALVGHLQIEQPNWHNVVVLPDSAFAGILIGLCLLGVARGWQRLSLAVAAVLLALCGYSLLHNLMAGENQGSSLLSGFLRMRNSLAMLMVFLALAMLSSFWGWIGKGFCRAIGFSLLAIGLAAILARWLPGLEHLHLGFKPATANIANLYALTLGAAMVLLPQLPDPIERREQVRGMLSLGAGALGSLLTCLVWYLLSLQNIDVLNRQSELLLSEARAVSEKALEDRLALVRRMSERWEVFGQLPSPELWEHETGSYLRDLENLRLLAVMDEALRPYQLRSRTPTDLHRFEHFLELTPFREWLEGLRRQGLRDISPALLHEQEAPTALIVSPLRLPEQPIWLLITEFNLPDLLEPLLNGREGDLVLRIFEGDLQLYGPPANSRLPSHVPLGVRRVDLPHGVEWRLESYLANPQQGLSRTDLPPVVMIFGLVFSFFIVFSLSLAQLSIERSKHLHEANRELEASMRHQASLQALNQRIMECSLDVLCSIDEQGRFTQVSPSSQSVFGYPPQDMIGRLYLDFVQPEDRAQAASELHAIIDGGTSQAMRHTFRRRDGSTVYILWSAAWSSSDRSLFAVAHDITPIVQNEAYTEDQRDILSMISTDQSLTEILNAICHMAEAQDPTALCSIMLVDDDKENLYLGAGPNLPEGYRQALDKVAIGPLSGSCGTAVYLRQMVVAEDIASDPLWQNYRDLALKHSLRACWSIPLISHKSEVLGSLAVYHRAPLGPDDVQLQLISTASQLAAIALTRQQDRLLLQESEQRYRSLFTFNPDPVFSVDLTGKYQSMNQAGCELSGYAEQELIGNSFSMLGLPEDMPRIREHFKAACAGEPQHFEARCRSRKGELFVLDVTSLPIKVGGEIVGVFGIAKDISERNRMTDALRVALQHSKHQAALLRGLSDTAVNLGSLLHGQALLDYLVKRLRLLIGTHQASIRVLYSDAKAQSIEAISFSEKYSAWGDLRQERLSGSSYPLLTPDDRPILLTQAELEAHPGWHGFGPDRDVFSSVNGWLAIPLKDRSGQNVGLLQLSDKNEGEFDQDDLAIAQHFSQMTTAVFEINHLMRKVLAGEQRLQEQLDFTSAITDSITEGLTAIDTQGRLTFVNPAAARLIGKPAAELLGQSLTALLPLSEADWRGGAATGLHGEFRLMRADGKEMYMAYDVAPLLSAQQESGWVVAFRDVSAQSRADQAMRERDQFFTLSLEMFCMLDLEGRFIQVNPAFLSVLGHGPEHLIGEPYLKLIADEDRPVMYEAIRQMQRGSPIQDLEVRLLDTRGQWHWLQLSAALGEDKVIYCAARDISERKEAEQALQSTLRELERSNRELQEFAFVASHDLQEPLRKIQAFSERLQNRAGGLDEESRDYLERMSSAAGRMQSLIRDLLAYSRVTSRGQPFERLSLDRILDEVLQDLETALESSGASVTREPLPDIEGDPVQMRQLLQNLLSNAIKFHREGEPARIRVYADKQTPGEWTLCVADQGIGFEEKYLDRIFNPFQRLHGRQTYPGTGIGLAIVKKIVERHGATVTANSCPGQGTTFRITFKMPVVV